MRLKYITKYILTAQCLWTCVFAFCSGLAAAQDLPDVSGEMSVRTVSESVSDLEREAFEAYSHREYERASLLFNRCEQLLSESEYDETQPDLLFDQALSNCRAGHYPLALAQLRQLTLVKTDAEILSLMDRIQKLIEIRAGNRHPNTVFVRGDSDEYLLWSWTHYYSEEGLRLLLFISVCIFFITLSAYLVLKKPVFRKLSFIIMIYFVIFILALSAYGTAKLVLDRLEFCVLLDSGALRQAPVGESPPLEQNSFLPGTVLKIVSQRATWLLLERSDGQTIWAPESSVYRLKAKLATPVEVVSEASLP